MRGLLFSLFILALIFCHAIGAEDLVEAEAHGAVVFDRHPKDVRGASSETAERGKRFQTCDGETFWEKTGYAFLSLFVKLNC